MFKILVLPLNLIRLFFRVAGVKGGGFFVLGVLLGLLFAPQTGPELRARLQARLSQDGAGGLPADEDLTL